MTQSTAPTPTAPPTPAPAPSPDPLPAVPEPASEATPAVPAPDFVAQLKVLQYDAADPDPLLAMALDRSIPMDEQARAALILNLRSFAWRRLHWLFLLWSRFLVIVFGLFRLIAPRAFASSRLLHRLIRWGLETFVRPEAQFLILRHFHIGSELLTFIKVNAGAPIETDSLRPANVRDLEDNVFLRHDLNLYNFVIRLNQQLQADGRRLVPPPALDFTMVTSGPFPLRPTVRGRLQFMDVASAVEVYTPLYELLLSDRDFRRAVHSLQFDETIGVYVASLLGDPTHLSFVNNRHPLIPLSPLRAGHRLVLHGLASEGLHALLVHHKAAQAAARGGASPGWGMASFIGARATPAPPASTTA